MEAAKIHALDQELQTKLSHLNKQVANRKNELQDALHVAQFERDANEVGKGQNNCLLKEILP